MDRAATINADVVLSRSADDDDLGAVSGEGADDVMAAVAAMTRRDRNLEASLPRQKAAHAPAQTSGEPASDSDDEARVPSMSSCKCGICSGLVCGAVQQRTCCLCYVRTAGFLCCIRHSVCS